MKIISQTHTPIVYTYSTADGDCNHGSPASDTSAMISAHNRNCSDRFRPDLGTLRALNSSPSCLTFILVKSATRKQLGRHAEAACVRT
eukprot:5109091-Prymnesium_polylepis.1